MKYFVTDYIGKSAYHIEGVDHSVLAEVNEYLNLYGKGHTFEEFIALPYVFKDDYTPKSNPEACELSVCAAIGQYIGDNNLIPSFTIYVDAKQMDETYNIHQIDVYWNCLPGEERKNRSLDTFSLQYFSESETLKFSVLVENRWMTIEHYPNQKEIAVQLLKSMNKFKDIDFQ